MYRAIKYTAFIVAALVLLLLAAVVGWKAINSPAAVLKRWTGITLVQDEQATEVKYNWAGWSESYRHFHINDPNGRIKSSLITQHSLSLTPGAQSAMARWLPDNIASWDVYTLNKIGPGPYGAWANPEVMLWHEPTTNRLILELWHW